jgi:predicted PurR-regulated permease PerM
VRILCSLAVGVITYLILAPFGFNFVVLISVIAGVFNLIPIFGPIIAIILNSLLLLIANPAQVIWYIILAIVMQQIEGNLVEPKLMGDRMGLPVLWVLFGVLAGGGFFGILGMLIGVPLLAIIYSLMQALIESRLQKKQLDIF